jgi:hypothetical protein
MNDKVLHFIAGLIISLLFGYLCYPFFGFIMAFFVGGLKELVWDFALDRGTPDLKDLHTTALGGFVGFVVMLFLRDLLV